MRSVGFSLGSGNNLDVSFLVKNDEIKQAEILEKRLDEYVTKLRQSDIHYTSGGSPNFFAYTHKLIGEMGEMSIDEATMAAADVTTVLQKLYADSSESFELYHLVALTVLALAEEYGKQADLSGSEKHIGEADRGYLVADKFFNDALERLASNESELPGVRAGILADKINAKRRRLGSDQGPGFTFLEDGSVNEVLGLYKDLLNKYTFTNEEEMATNIARYLDTLSFTVQGSKDLNKYQNLTETLQGSFPHNKQAKDTLDFYAGAIAK